MGTMATRERKLQFMRDGGSIRLRSAVMAAFDREGPDFLTDEQLDRIVQREVEDWRDTQHMNMRNRARMEAAE